MKTWMLAGLLAAAPASASESRFYKLFDVNPSAVEKAASEAVAKMDGVCTYSQFSRLPPRPEAMRACNAAEEKVVAMGPAGARAAMAHLDDEKAPPTVRNRLYDVIGRTGDASFIEPLVAALEREATPREENGRTWERHGIVRALQTLTYAELPGTPSIQWRIWCNAHKGQTREQMFTARAGESREALSQTIAGAATGARWLLAQPATRAEGAAALGRLFARADLSAQDRNLLNQVAYSAGITPPSTQPQPQVAPQAEPVKVAPQVAPQKKAGPPQKVAGLAS